ncbi:pro-thyrotropin-releasing hormone [Sebastes umbrosus]|uniref:pro-thyrotropin-releasing hormone n=1 Tax=Sebastes umbrosus TaxID=72105 RepID=UPI00189E5061|nr:pro-thyrotropin-releasing hormone [Sebastes umbrosus]XP_037627709.1 pro-thyrotropin-releasing hormone [Sebastes umbrosus]
MKSTCLLILASLVVCNLTESGGQDIPAEDETDGRRTIDDIILQKAESLLLRSILKKMQEEDGRNEGSSFQTEWVTKRQHPGKRYSEDLEKRQHPGRREEGEDEQQQFLDLQKRQHPGKREDEMHSFMQLQKRQHPGKRFTMETENPVMLLSELSKRQHPGKKRYVVLHSKRQHPGKRHQDEEEDEDDDDWDADGDEEDLAGLEKRQHPGKRFWDNSSPDLGTNSPCDVLDPTSCSKTSLLLDFLDNINKSHAEEKRQHPGKRFAPEEDLVEEGE